MPATATATARSCVAYLASRAHQAGAQYGGAAVTGAVGASEAGTKNAAAKACATAGPVSAASIAAQHAATERRRTSFEDAWQFQRRACQEAAAWMGNARLLGLENPVRIDARHGSKAHATRAAATTAKVASTAAATATGSGVRSRTRGYHSHRLVQCHRRRRRSRSRGRFVSGISVRVSAWWRIAMRRRRRRGGTGAPRGLARVSAWGIMVVVVVTRRRLGLGARARLLTGGLLTVRHGPKNRPTRSIRREESDARERREQTAGAK